MGRSSELFDERLQESGRSMKECTTSADKCRKFGLKVSCYEDSGYHYCIIDSKVPIIESHEKYLCEKIASHLVSFIGCAKNILVVGLGNRHISSDSLGSNAVKYIVPKHGRRGVAAITTSVRALTGVAAYDFVHALVDRLDIDLVIMVDSLCANNPNRLCASYQIHDEGIVPGGGVDNDQKTICSRTIGVPVIVIGVPMVVYASAFGVKDYPDMIMTPKDIDILSNKISRIVGNSINMATHHMTYETSRRYNENIF